MSEMRPGGPFMPGELDGVAGVDAGEVAALTAIARDLGALAGRDTFVPSASFTDRVMATIRVEPSPVPARAAGRAIRRGSLGALLASIRDAGRVSLGNGFPAIVRAQALAVLLVVVALGAGTATATAGALGAFRSPVPAGPDRPSPVAPGIQVLPDASPSDALEPVPSPTPESSDPANDPEETSPADDTHETPEPTERASTNRDGGGGTGDGTSGGDSSGGADGSEADDGGSSDSGSEGAATPRATSTPEVDGPGETSTPRPTETAAPTESADLGSGSDG
jgi:hypothetical protein